MTKDGVPEIVAWLVDGARSAAAPEDVLEQLCDRLLACSVPLSRAAVFVRTLHPAVMGRRFRWRRGERAEVMEATYDILETPDFHSSPVVRVCTSGMALRRRVGSIGAPIEFPILEELRAAGTTDYLALPLFFTDGSTHAVTWATERPGGFAEGDLAAIEAVAPPLARVAEIRAWRRTASNLLDAYVGHSAGERILSGHIRRGDSEAIDAAIWLSDMRGFTALADRLPGPDLIQRLNRYFDCQIPAILGHGGEVLKFIGDGLLAIFPVADGAAARASTAALAAAREAREALRGEHIAFGLALNLGTVLYGNIGGGNRLDFTCIGPAVNLAARIEKLSARLGRTILASEEFAWQHRGQELVSLGKFELAGVSGAKQIFGLVEEAPAVS